MLNAAIQDAFNRHINAEIQSSYLYLSMAAYLDSENLAGMAHWMKVQAKEELGHAMKFFGFVVERGGRVTLAAVDAPPATWESPAALFAAVYQHECKVTALIHALYEKAAGEKDYASMSFLQKFIDEQVEEEAAASGIAERLRVMGDSKGGLYMLDHHLGERTAG
jgi:ferritin